MKLESIKVNYNNEFVNKYLYDFPSVQHLYTLNPINEDSFKERLDTVLKEYTTDRDELVRVLLSYNKEMGCSKKTEENLELLKNNRAQVIITGQQAGVFTGPLYTIYKIMTTIQLAKKKSRELDIPVIPVFWVAAEDHDYFEINHLDIINRQGEPERICLQDEPSGKYSVGNISINESVFELIDEFAEKTNPSEWKDGLIEELKEFAKSSDNLADWFARILSKLFKDYGLILVNPMLPGIRKLMTPIYEQFILNCGKVNEALQVGQNEVIKLGFSPQVDKSSDHVHLFRYIEGERLPLLQEGSSYTVRGKDLMWTQQQLIEALRDNPEEFSPNVVLRPIAQDYIFPLMAYVAGPGEISYYALYKKIYPIFDMSMPLIYPRVNITLVEGNIIKLMNKYSLSVGDVFEGLETKLKEYLKELEEVDIDELFGNLKNQVQNLYQEVGEQVKTIDPNVLKNGEDSLNKVCFQIDRYHEKVQQSHRKNNEVITRRFEKISNNLYPKDNYQERVFNIYQYLIKHGPDMIKELMELPLIEGLEHKLVHF